VEKALKQRLTGAIVLVISGVVLIPLLLDGAGYNARFSKDIEIPPAPVIKIKSWDELKEIPANVPAAKVKTPSTERKKPTSQAKVSNKHTTKPSIKAWALQLGSFSQQTNALVLQDQLRAKGYRAFVVKSKKSSNTRYEVRIGPDLDRSKIEKIAKKLKNSGNRDSLIVTHP
jgi:DedD protein